MLLLHRNSKDWIAYLKANNYCLPLENTCSFLTRNFDTAITQAKGINAVSFRPAQFILTACGLTWSLSVAVKLGSFDLTFGRAKKACRFVNLVNCIGRNSPKRHNAHFYYLVTLGVVIIIQTHKLASGIAEIPKMLEHIRGTLKNRLLPEGYKSMEHVIQEALIASFIYGMQVSRRKFPLSPAFPYFP